MGGLLTASWCHPSGLGPSTFLKSHDKTPKGQSDLAILPMILSCVKLMVRADQDRNCAQVLLQQWAPCVFLFIISPRLAGNGSTPARFVDTLEI